MATKTINSDKSETKVGTSGTKLFTSTRTTYGVDANGKIDPKSVKHEVIYYDAPLSPGIVAATSTGTSNDWKFEKNIAGKPILGTDAQKSLKEGALKSTIQQQIQTAATKEKISAEQQKALSTKQINTASTPEGADGTQPVALDVQGSGLSRTESGSFGNYRYPENLASTKQDIIKFTMLKYEPRQFQTGKENLGGFAERTGNRTTLGTVVLPIPSGISESNGVTWGQDTMTPSEAIMANIALTSIKKGLSEGFDKIGEAAAGASGSSDVKNAVAAGFAEAATGVGGLMSRTQGAIINPNMELLFQGPSLRPFNFSFKMSARSKSEAKQIIKIIRFFKQGMSPQKSESNLFLKSPHTFRVQYIHQPLGPDASHPYIGEIKECALQNFVVNYTPENQYATFQDGVMVSYEIQMTFQELEPVFNEDYGNTGSLPEDLLFKPAKK